MALTAFATVSPVRSLYAADRDYSELLGLFADRLPAVRGEIETAWHGGQMADLAGLAHQLHKTAADYGFPELATTASRVSQLLRDDPASDVGTAYTKLLEQLRRVQVGFALG